MRAYISIISTACLMAAWSAHADEAPAPEPDVAGRQGNFEQIVVSATRTPQLLSKVGASVTVISQEALRNTQTIVISDALAQTPGVTFSRNGGIGGTTALRIRGAETDQTVVVIDGVKLNDPAAAGGGFNFANLLIGDIQRVEILRGAQSTLWGSQAIGGVVNIVTTAPEKPFEANANLEGGSFNTGYGIAGVGGKTEKFMWRANGGYYTTDGVSAYVNGREPDGYHNVGFSGRGKVAITDTVSAEVRAVYSRGRNSFDGFPAPAFVFADTREVATTKELVGYAGVTADTFDGRLKSRFAYGYTDTDRGQVNPDQAVTPTTFKSKGKNRRWEYQGSLALADHWTAVFGAESEHSAMTSASPSSFTPNPAPIVGAVTINSGYGQIQGEVLPGLTLTGGLRHDSHDIFGGHTLGQAAAAWAFNDGATVLRTSFGQGFKAPTLYQLYSPFGNTRLKPESAESWDGGIEQHFADGAVKVVATGFLRDTTNQIDFVSCPNVNPLCTPGKSGVYDNIARTRAYGFELAGAVQVAHIAVEAYYTYTHTENTAAGNVNRGKALARRPVHTANVSATYVWDIPLTTGIGLRYAGNAFDDAANRNVLGHYTLVDLRASWAINDTFDLYGRLENTFDVKYATTRNYGTMGRGVYGGVRAHF